MTEVAKGGLVEGCKSYYMLTVVYEEVNDKVETDTIFPFFSFLQSGPSAFSGLYDIKTSFHK